jgi:hypothetical protein
VDGDGITGAAPSAIARHAALDYGGFANRTYMTG